MKHEINVPKGCKVISVETTDEMVVVKFEKDEPKFKENDIVTTTVDDEDYVSIVKNFTNNLLKIKITTTSDLDYFINKEGTLYYDTIRLATESEKQLLFDKLKEKCLMFDGKDVVRWRANFGSKYWLISEFGCAEESIETSGQIDDDLRNTGNYFPTRELAEAFQKQYIELLNNFHKNL